MKDYVPHSAQPERPNQRKKGSDNLLFSLLKGGVSLLGILIILSPVIWVPAHLARQIESVGVTGNHVLTAEEVVGALELSDQETWFDVDPFDLENRGLSEPWIESIDIKKTSTLGLAVHIGERQPVAYLKANQQIYLLDHSLMVLGLPERWNGWDLPVLSTNRLTVTPGDRLRSAGVNRAFELMNLLKEDPVLPLSGVSEIKLDNPMNLVVITQPGGLQIKMGFDHFEEKLHRLHLASQDLANREKRLAYIDLRHPQGVVIKRR